MKNLPTQDTWGIAVHERYGAVADRWSKDYQHLYRRNPKHLEAWSVESVLTFIPLTTEQVEQIEKAMNR